MAARSNYQWRSYTEAQRAEAVALSMTIGTKAASAQLGIPRRTLSSWIKRPSDDVQAAIASTRTDVAASFWAVVDAGTKAMLAKIADPKTRAGELAAVVKTAVESHALLTGGATARTANVNVSVDATDAFDEMTWEEDVARRKAIIELKQLAEGTDEDLEAWLTHGQRPDGVTETPGLVQLREHGRQYLEMEREDIAKARGELPDVG